MRLKKEQHWEARAGTSQKLPEDVPPGKGDEEGGLNKTCFPGEVCGPLREDWRAGR